MNLRRFVLAAFLPLVAGVLAAPAERAAPVRPRENPRLVFRAARYPGWQAWNVADPFVLREGAVGRYLLFYAGTGSSRLNTSVWDDWSIGVSTSADGRTFDVGDDYDPILVGRRWMEGEVLDPDELRTSFDSVAVSAPCVLRDSDGYRMWYTGWNGDSVHEGGGKDRMLHQRIGLAASSDGCAWKKLRGGGDLGAVLGLGTDGSPDAEAVRQPWVRRERGGYRMWYEGADGRTTRILSAASRDGLRWERQGVALDLGAPGAPDALGLGRPVVIERQGRLELWYRGVAAGRAHARLLRAVSRDGLRWTKLPGEIDLWGGRAAQGDAFVGSILVGATGECHVYFATKRSLPPARDGAPRTGLEIFVVAVNP
jgi:hypothetical protein